VCKRVLNRVKSDKVITLMSDNATYKTYRENIEDVLALFRVRVKLSSNLTNENANIQRDVHKSKDDIEAIFNLLKKAGLKKD
jgi:glycerol dehydrogenase-like iron-containing ADH family enzyme